MRFWDSSAVIPLLVGERSSATVLDLLSDDRRIHVWWATEIECLSTLSRLEREKIDPAIIGTASARLAALRGGWSEVSPRIGCS